MSKGPYKPGPVPQWLIAQQSKQYEAYMQNNYMAGSLNSYDSTPDVYIMGYHYDGKTGKLVNA